MSEMTENAYGIQVKRCCASCAYKKLTRLMTLRRCTKHRKNVKPGYVCKDWVMSDTMKSAGKTTGFRPFDQEW